MLTVVVDTAVIDAIIDISAFIGDIADIANITIYLQDNDTADITNTTIYRMMAIPNFILYGKKRL